MKTNTTPLSLYVTLGLTILLTVMIIMLSHATYTYIITKQNIIQDMKKTSALNIRSLEKGLSYLIRAYAINEYDKLVQIEMERHHNLAIIIDDYYMGKAIGKEVYISGKIRDIQGNIVDYNPDDKAQNLRLKHCYYTDQYTIFSSNKKPLGTIHIYISDDFMQTALHKIILNTTINALILSLLLIISLFISIHFFILKPLADMMSIIHKHNNGLPLYPIPAKGPKEIAALTNTINNMIQAITRSRNTLEKQAKVLQHQAYYDALTGLTNRHLFFDRLVHGIEQSKRNQVQMALLFIDLDNFKEINDSLGHSVGDKVLKVIAERLSKVIRKEDTLARLGGDEFTILISNINQAQHASILANKVIEVISQSIVIDNQRLHVGSSIGISLYPNDGESAQDLLKNADAAMYKAKHEGKNNYQYYNATMTALALERVTMETHLRTAIQNEDFIVYYQPQINAKYKQHIGMEALVRWIHPTMGFISPAKFIPLAESTGLIIELDQYIMKTAMQQIVRWHEQGLQPGHLSLNLAIKQLQQKNFIYIIKKLLTETHCQPQWVELEITESQIMTHPEDAIKMLINLSQLGIKLSIDDFGTGYSSLSYLKKLPIHKLKIDQSFVRDLPFNEEDAAITKAVIALAKSLKLQIIAEGVETKEQKTFLLQNGCHNIQGYYYSKPLSAKDLEDYLLQRVKIS